MTKHHTSTLIPKNTSTSFRPFILYIEVKYFYTFCIKYKYIININKKYITPYSFTDLKLSNKNTNYHKFSMPLF